MSIKNNLTILAYHSIDKETNDTLTIAESVFNAQIKWLIDSDFIIISLSEAIRQLQDTRANLHRKVVLTFDDGYSNFYKFAAPILDKFGLCATIFVVTNKVGQYSDWNRLSKPRPLMSLSDLHDLVSKGHLIGSHTANHTYLPNLMMTDLQLEINKSREFLEEQFGMQEFTFSYPYGAYGTREIQVVNHAGYLCACDTRSFRGNDHLTNLYRLRRFELYSHHSLKKFKSIMTDTMPWPIILDTAHRHVYHALQNLGCFSGS